MSLAIGRSKDGYPTLNVYVQPRSSRNRCGGLHEYGLKIMVAAPPVEGKANKAAKAYLAELFGVKANTIVLASGEHARKKTFYFTSLSEDSLADRLNSLL
ncbi:MAG: DUF167 domain-containing protein [Desulfofustis sp.]|nr:DUF167 domain-containing protein [Desulfofustis sp.]MBT8354437.1 DUF167 domain-containing protein [Desulfofustis sp.]